MSYSDDPKSLLRKMGEVYERKRESGGFVDYVADIVADVDVCIWLQPAETIPAGKAGAKVYVACRNDGPLTVRVGYSMSAAKGVVRLAGSNKSSIVVRSNGHQTTANYDFCEVSAVEHDVKDDCVCEASVQTCKEKDKANLAFAVETI